MADNTQGLPVITKSGEFVSIKLVDTGGTNVASVSAANALKVDGSAVTQPVSDAGGSLTVDGSVSITGSVTVDSELPAAAALADNTANPTVPAVGSFLMAYDGSTWDRMLGNSTDGLLVNLGANNDITLAGNVTVIGPTAHDAAVAQNPQLVAAYASAAAPTNVSADGDVVRLWALRNGAMATVLTAAGALIGGDATNGLDVDVTRMSALVAGTANIGDVDIVGGTVASDAVHSTNPVTIGGRASTAVPSAVSGDGDVVDARFLRTGAMVVHVVDSAGAAQTFTGGTQYVGDAAATSTPTGTMAVGLANSAAPADVSANNDAVAAWHLRNGAAATVLTAAGALIGGDATNGLDVDVTRVPAPLSTTGGGTEATALRVTIATDSTGVVSVDDNGGSLTVDGTVGISGTVTVDSELPTAASLADATANPTVPGVGSFLLGYNGSTWDRVRTANTGRLQVDVITGGGASGGLTSAQYDYATTSNLGAGASADLDFDDIAGTTGELHGMDIWSAAPLKVLIRTVTGGTPTTRVVIGTRPGETFTWRPPHQDYITHAAGAGNFFRANVTNLGSQASDVHSTAYWDEI